MYQMLNEMAGRKAVDLLHITMPSNYQALLGRFLWERHRIPYILDYTDPWVPESDQGAQFPSKAWASYKLADILEPVAAAHASGLAGITEKYFAGVLRRNPQLHDVPRAAFQMGCSKFDHEKARQLRIPVRRLEKSSPLQQIVYAGALLPKAIEPMRCFLRALATINSSGLKDHPIRFICLGTGSSRDDPSSHQILPIARSVGAEEWVREYPERHPYLEVLATLAAADGGVILGSTEPHYSPSKLFEALLAGRPVLAVLHRQSEAAAILKNSGGGIALTFDSILDKERLTEDCVRLFQSWPTPCAPPIKWESLAQHDIAVIAEKVAAFYDEVIAYHERENS